MEDFEALHLACAFDMRVPQNRMAETMRLLSLINEQMLFGHFDLWLQDGSVMYRHATPLAGGAEPTRHRSNACLESALTSCERYYQAFQFVVWAGKREDALAACCSIRSGRRKRYDPEALPCRSPAIWVEPCWADGCGGA